MTRLVAAIGLTVAAACTPAQPDHVAITVATTHVPDESALGVVASTTTTTAAPAPVRATATRRPSQPVAVGPSILERIAWCESKGSYTAQNPTSSASGKYQVIKSTWGGYGGYAEAWLAPPHIQEAHAYELFAREGTKPWRASQHCWG